METANLIILPCTHLSREENSKLSAFKDPAEMRRGRGRAQVQIRFPLSGMVSLPKFTEGLWQVTVFQGFAGTLTQEGCPLAIGNQVQEAWMGARGREKAGKGGGSLAAEGRGKAGAGVLSPTSEKC